MTKKKTTSASDFEKSVAGLSKDNRYVLRLFITGMTARSSEAIAALKEICEEHLQGRYDLEVIDIYQHPERAKQEQILAMPTLVKKLPLPMRKLIGNLSDKERVLIGLDLLPKA
ncbi:MAG: circadian clock KaiB family protein [Phycisphaerales bacterium]